MKLWNEPVSYVDAEFLAVDVCRRDGDDNDVRIGMTLTDPDGDPVNISLSIEDMERLVRQAMPACMFARDHLERGRRLRLEFEE